MPQCTVIHLLFALLIDGTLMAPLPHASAQLFSLRLALAACMAFLAFAISPRPAPTCPQGPLMGPYRLR